MRAAPVGRADPLVGRDAELAALGGSLTRAQQGHGSVALVSGEPGIGKSAMCGALARLAEAQGATVRWGRCSEVEGAPPFWPWRQILGRWPERAAGVDRFSFLDDLAHEVLDLAGDDGLVVVVEDVHWADEDSLMLLAHLGRQLDDRPVLVIATYRHEQLDAGGSLERTIAGLVTSALSLPLGGLDRAAVAALLQTLAPSMLDGAGAGAVAERSDGNPFFVTQLARSWAEGAERGAGSVPHGVRAVVRARLAALDEAHLEVLRTAATIGRSFDLGTVQAIAGEATAAAVEAASRRNLLVRTDRPGQGRFVHALVREVLEQETDAAVRTEIHRAAVEQLESAPSADAEALAALARHALAAAPALHPDRVARHVQAAAAAALDGGGAREAIRLCRRGVALEAGPRTHVDLLVLLGRALFNVDELQESERVLVQASEEAHALGDDVAAARALLEIGSGRLVLRFDPSLPERLATAHARLPPDAVSLRALVLSRYADFADDPDAVESACRAAFADARGAGDPEAVVQTGVRLLLNGSAWMPLSERQEVVSVMQQALGAAPPRDLAFNVTALRSRVLLEQGALDDAVADARAADEVFRGLSVLLHMGDVTEAAVALARGQLERAEELDAAIVAETTRRGAVAVLAPTTAARQSAIARERDGGRSIVELLEPVRTQLRSTRGGVADSRSVEIALALSLAETGDADGARSVIDDVLEADLERIAKGWGGNDLGLMCLLVQAAHDVGVREAADRLLRIVGAATDRNVVLGMPPTFLLGHGAHFSGLCHHLAGRLDQAVHDLEVARAANRQMRAIGPMVRTHLALASVHAECGDGATAVARLRQARAALEGTGLDDLRQRVRLRLEAIAPGGSDGAPPGTTTFVFTDIVDSTARTRAAGDRAWRTVLDEHASLLRALALRHGGRVVKGLGDGFMLTFSSVRDALDFATALQGDQRTADLGVRVGVHTGEAERVDDDHIGHHVNLAARVAGAAAGGEVLVSETVHAIASTTGDLRFGPARVERLKGIGDVALRPLRTGG